MTFSLLILGRQVAAGEEIFNIAALAVVAVGRASRADGDAGHQVDRET